MFIQEFIQKIQYQQCILISYSGGLDSTVLLYQLIPFMYQYPFLQLRAIHINHQINNKSEIWSQHCHKICQKNNITLKIQKVFFKNKKNFQNHARKVRYQIIKKYMLKNEILVTGHHLNDQCETLFLSLKRGSGLPGLSGIASWKYLEKEKKIFRPLIKYKKIEIKKWAILNHIPWIEDDSNFQNIYDRNFIRNKILTPIEKKWPIFLENCYRSMKICYKQDKALNYFLDQILIKNKLLYHNIKVSIIESYIQEIQIILIKRWIFLNIKKNISYNKIKEIHHKLIKEHSKNPKYSIKINNYKIFRYKNIIYQIFSYPDLKNTIIYWHNHNKSLKLPYHLGELQKNQYGTTLPKPKKKDLVSIRFHTCKIISINNKYHKKIKNIWQENNIPPWNRNRIPIIFYNEKIISIIGIINFSNYYNDIWKISWTKKII
ncbi:tRNA(Ile)-lysidine synthase [Buchnera aphidicola (Myzocallis carpini)]